jgi:hypothetical protein
MGLSRLDNFLKNARGNILYVNPNDLDSTDSIENQGNSLTRPFKTIQRALIEAARFSYQRGLNNDRFGKTTILVYPGDHIVDNRPGWIPDGVNSYQTRSGQVTNNFAAWDLTTNFDLTTSDNALYKMNSVHGGVIIPRGTSLVGLDLRKTKIRPKYVPDPTNANIERTALFRVTGGCYFWQFSMFDADPNGQCFVDYTENLFVPNFSHHKLTCFEYADGVNPVVIKDAFLNYTSTRTDLDMYYEKVGLAYGPSSGREIQPDYPSSGLDIQPKIDEFRIVGSTGLSVGISSIKSGNGVTPTTTITVTTVSPVDGLDVDTPFRVEGISASGYNGQFVVSEKLSDTEIQYQVQNSPTVALPPATSATLSLNSDTVTSASPYIFNVSLRSVYGMCGLLADGDKATGFKSMVVAQFTGIGLQKDDKAFVLYNTSTGQFDDNTKAGNETISTNSRAVFKPDYRNFHIKAVNDAFIQNVSIFAIGYAEHFVCESGGDMSITNSNSNFGAKALVASGFRRNAFPQDDVGYITHIIPPKEVPLGETSIEFDSIDVSRTIPVIGVGSTGHLYLYNQSNSDVPPENVLEGYRFGAKTDERLNVLISVGGTVVQYNARVVMPGSQSSSEKSFTVDRSPVGINSIGQYSKNGAENVVTLTQPHTFANGESIRIISDTGQIPDGLINNQVYYAITSGTGISTNTDIKIAKTLNEALDQTAVDINELGGVLKIVSRVSDKNSGDIGHPIQFDESQNQWYVKVSTSSTDNTLYPALVGLGTTALGAATPRTFIARKQDNRNAIDTIYRVRYVIPAGAGVAVARPPSDGFILQESNTSIGATTAEIASYFGSGSLSNVNQQRNFRFIANANWSVDTANILTELPHDLSIGSQVELVNVTSTTNISGTTNSGYNGTFYVTGISSAREFSVGINTDPGEFTNNTSLRNTSLPYFKRKRYNDVYYVYRTQEAQKYVNGEQDGIYYITLVNASNTPSLEPFVGENYSQPVKELYPQINRDNPESDPREASSFAVSSLVGEVVVNDVQNSITKETINKVLKDIDVGVGVTNFISVDSNVHQVYTAIDHGFNRITRVSIANSGSGYGSGAAGDIYNAKLVGFAGSTTGHHASAKITVDSFGGITDIKIMDGGSAYGIGNTLAVVGVSTFGTYSEAVITVTNIYDNTNDVVRISGVSSESNNKYNTLYRISEIPVGIARSFTVISASPISGVNTTSLGSQALDNSFIYLTGKSVDISAVSYDNVSGIATVTTTSAHGFRVDNKITISGADQSIYNGSFVVNQIASLTTFSVEIGVGNSSPTFSGTALVYRGGYTSNDGVITVDNENTTGRMVSQYAGITTTLSAIVSTPTTDQISITNIQNLDINIGDYLQINDEIVRVKTAVPSVPSNPIEVFRGVLGTKRSTHAINSVVRRIKVNPVELRRHSISRASGHTFEYVGFGPGNYSTAFPDKQDRQISPQEELLAQSTRREGGINFYTGMNDKGISYSGNKKLSTVTGQEEIFDTPIQTISGEDIGNDLGLNVINPTEAIVGRAVRVEGGPDNKTISEFKGPVVFSNKITSTSDKGIESNSLFLQGDSTVSRKYTVGISTPSLAGNPGDIVYYENPNKGGYVGWIYTVDNDWYRFGSISLSKTENIGIFDRIGVGTDSPGDCTLRVGSGTSLFCVDGDGVGIGTSANGFKLNVNGNTNISGDLTATTFYGDGSGLTNLSNDSLWSPVTGVGTGIYPNNLIPVGIGTSIPNYNLEVGSPGSASTSIYVNGKAVFAGFTTTADVTVGGMLTSTTYRLDGDTSNIRAGIVTTSTLIVGTGGTVITTTTSQQIGIGTVTPRNGAKVDIEGHVRFKTYSENVEDLTIVSNTTTVDLSKAVTFLLSATDNIDYFTITNAPAGASSFTLKITQDSTGSRVIDIDDFRTTGGSPIAVYWPGGGVLPIVTPTADRTDIYRFMTFDGGTTFYGIVIGQNFVN